MNLPDGICIRSKKGFEFVSIKFVDDENTKNVLMVDECQLSESERALYRTVRQRLVYGFAGDNFETWVRNKASEGDHEAIVLLTFTEAFPI